MQSKMLLTRYRTSQPVQAVLKSPRAATVTPARDALVALRVSTAMAPKFNERCSRHTRDTCTRQTGEDRLRTPSKATQALCRPCCDGRHSNPGHPASGLQESACALNRGALDAPAGDCRSPRGARSTASARCGSPSAPDRPADAGGRHVRSAQAGRRGGKAHPLAVARPDDGIGHLLDGDRASQFRGRDRRSLQVQVLGQGEGE